MMTAYIIQMSQDVAYPNETCKKQFDIEGRKINLHVIYVMWLL